MRRYYVQNAAAVKIRVARYYQTHKDEVAAYKKLWTERDRLEHPEKYRMQTRLQYLKTPREKRIERLHRYYARKLINGGSHTEAEWHQLLETFGNRCLRCGSTKNIEKDHIIPIAVGGSNSIHNLQPLCRRCNARKSTKTVNYIPDFMFAKALVIQDVLAATQFHEN